MMIEKQPSMGEKMSDEDKIDEPDFEKDSLLDFSKGPTELSSAKPSQLGKKPDADSDANEPSLNVETIQMATIQMETIQERIKKLDKIIEESKATKTRTPEKVKFTPIEKAKPFVEPETPQVEEPESPPLMPWEIDVYGRPLKDKTKEKEKTSYEIWLDEKREKEGVKIKCPNCGADNIDLPFVTGEKCSECGFNLDADEDLTKKMQARDQRAGMGSKSRVTEFSTRSLKMSLDLPDEIVQNPNIRFNGECRSNSYTTYLAVAIAATIGALFFFVRLATTHFTDDFDFYMMTFLIIVAIFAYYGLRQTLLVTRIQLDQEGATFYGSSAPIRIKYKNIAAITNKRLLNGRARSINLHTSPGIMFFLFGRLYFAFERYDHDYYWENIPDTSAISPYYNNHITLKAHNVRIKWVFCGHGNHEFIRALALLIYLGKTKNNNCLVNIPAIRAAEKVVIDYPNLY